MNGPVRAADGGRPGPDGSLRPVLDVAGDRLTAALSGPGGIQASFGVIAASAILLPRHARALRRARIGSEGGRR